MPEKILNRGHTANLGANQVHGDLQVIGVGASYTIAINGRAPTPHVIAPGAVNIYPINNQQVTVVNTTPPGGPANITLSW